MTIGYWKLMGEKIAAGLGAATGRRLGTSARILGRAGAAVGIGFLAYELFKSYKDNLESEPAYREMTVLRDEMARWTGAIACLGREPYVPKDFGDMAEGGAINALFPKKSLGGGGVKPPEAKVAAALVKRAAAYLHETENLFDLPDFEERKAALTKELEKLGQRILGGCSHRPIQERLSEIVAEIKPTENGYASRIYDCSREIQQSLGSNAAWAALSMVTLGIVKKPIKSA